VLEPAPALTLAIGLATVEAIAEATGIACDLRWPNDVMLDGKKCAGILVQLVDGKAIAGIGINVNHTEFPPDLAAEATSLRIVSGRAFSREAILTSLLPAIERYAALELEQILDLFANASSYVSGRRVVVNDIRGVTAGLDPTGFLKVRQDDGTVTLILAGGVRAQ
jgi:BirA family biotin operon repressor/biotin-[acetyl-CoA-carboxylase] ligase